MNIIIDSGPLVAILDKRDQYNEFAINKMETLPAPFYTCEAVITESFFLLQSVPQGSERLIALLSAEKIVFPFQYGQHSASVHGIMNKYADQPASFTDACLVAMYESLRDAHIFTLDSDFSIYRAQNGEPLQLIRP